MMRLESVSTDRRQHGVYKDNHTSPINASIIPHFYYVAARYSKNIILYALIVRSQQAHEQQVHEMNYSNTNHFICLH